MDLLLVDFENVQQVDFSCLRKDCRVFIFVGVGQKTVSIDLLIDAQKHHVEWIRVDGNGKNALDFFIAFHLGRIFDRSPDARCLVLSRDTGFDPLLRWVNRNGLKCRRINSLQELSVKEDNLDLDFQKVLEILKRSKQRPRRITTLSQHVSSIFQKKKSQDDIDRIIEKFLATKMISKVGTGISYEF